MGQEVSSALWTEKERRRWGRGGRGAGNPVQRLCPEGKLACKGQEGLYSNR